MTRGGTGRSFSFFADKRNSAFRSGIAICIFEVVTMKALGILPTRSTRSRPAARRLLHALVLLALVGGAVAATLESRPQPRAVAALPRAFAIQPRAVAALPAAIATPDPPPGLQQALLRLAEGFDGKVGVAVQDASNHWLAGFRTRERFPQQSVSKLWVAITLLDAVDHGTVRLDEPVTVRPADLTVFHQPLQSLVGTAGFATTIGDLMTRALTQSDNTANDILLHHVGGPSAVYRMLLRKRLLEIKFGPGERLLQSQIAGLQWKPGYADSWSFEKARRRLSGADRRAALAAYLVDPADGASPQGIVHALVALRKGELLSPASTALLLGTMTRSRTGHYRLRAGLSAGWTLAHKTGTGQELGNIATGFNDVGMLTAPSGRVYGAAVMIAESKAPIAMRQHLIASVAQAIIAYDSTL